ncbi:MAG TPA: MFS transporter [Bacteroidia bacterium]|nr:MFS transporter [Bacteroidia bacterium]HNT83480.1 MFS transporter [Bacteroidia bacterium]
MSSDKSYHERMTQTVTEGQHTNTAVRLWNRNFINACIANFLIACSFYLLMPTIPIFLSEQLHVSQSHIGLALSSYVVALLIMRPFSGYLVDVYPRKKLFMTGVTLFVCMFTGYYFAATVMFFVVLRFVHGLFWGLSTVSANTVAIDIIPSERRAEGIGFFGVTMNIAMATAPYIAVIIYDSFGFSKLVSSALMMGAFAILAVSFIKTPWRKKPDKKPPLSFDRFILIKGIPIFINQLFLSFGWGTLVAFAVLYGKKTGIHNAGIFFLFLASGIVLSRVNSGKYVDRGYLHRVVVIAISLITTGYFCFASFHNIYAFCASAFILGVGFGTLFPALQTIYNNMAPSTRRGTANSTYLTGFDLGIGIGMLAGAYISDVFDFSTLYYVTSGLSFIALFIYWFNSRKVYERNKIKQS